MDLPLLQTISLAVAESREFDRVLQMIVTGLVEQADCALARIWLLAKPCERTEPCLQLAASAGHSLSAEEPDWSGLHGRFSRFPIGSRKIGQIGSTGQPVWIENVSDDGTWIVDRDWARREQIRSFAGQPLLFRGEILGVLAVFSRKTLREDEFNWLRLFADHAAVAIANARAFEEIEALRRRLELENQYLREEVSESQGGIVGQSLALRNLLRQVDLVAPTEANVLILGESGTGKELIARAIHERSPRASGPLVKVNCASVPQELFESEFFGHAKGSFTGALRDRIGRFQLADGGTLFLDEVGEIPMQLQGKLLRVLQEREFERVGEDRARRVDVRIIAATNRDLPAEVAAGRFREDLYYRLSVFPVIVPPLRQRKDDIPVLAEHFLRQTSRRLNLRVPVLTAANLRELTAYAWPGNIRELQNVLERAVILSRGGPLVLDLSATVPAALRQVSPDGNEPRSLTRSELRVLERESIEAALAATQGKIYGKGGAAELLGMKPTTLASRMASLGITRGRKA